MNIYLFIYLFHALQLHTIYTITIIFYWEIEYVHNIHIRTTFLAVFSIYHVFRAYWFKVCNVTYTNPHHGNHSTWKEFNPPRLGFDVSFRDRNSIYGASMHLEQKPVEARPDFILPRLSFWVSFCRQELESRRGRLTFLLWNAFLCLTTLQKGDGEGEREGEREREIGNGFIMPKLPGYLPYLPWQP